jgi:hypothetical protein
MKRLRRATFAALLVARAASFGIAQPAAAKPASAFPFGAGERLVYEGKINKFAVSVTIGDLVFEVAEMAADKIRLKVAAGSRGTMLKLFRYSFEQTMDTLVDPKDLHAFSSIKHDVQKQKVRDSVTTFDYDRRMVTWVETDPKEPTRPPRTIATDLEGPTHDIVSGIYFLRTLPLAIGYSTTVNVSDSGLVYKIPVRVIARERQKTIFGEIFCWVVRPELFGRGRFFEQKGSMDIWITDDARRVPVRARINAEVGKVDIRLKETSNLK